MNGVARRVVLAFEGPSTQEIMYVALSKYWQKVKHRITLHFFSRTRRTIEDKHTHAATPLLEG